MDHREGRYKKEFTIGISAVPLKSLKLNSFEKPETFFFEGIINTHKSYEEQAFIDCFSLTAGTHCGLSSFKSTCLRITVYLSWNSKKVTLKLKEQFNVSDFHDENTSINIIDNIQLCMRKLSSDAEDHEYIDYLELNIEVIEISQELIWEKKAVVDDIKELFVFKEFADVVVKIDTENIEVHKFVLVSRSPVFRAMFNSDMLESRTNEITIQDIAPDCFKELLSYMYLGKISSDKHATLALALATDAYEVLDLKKYCENFQERNISVETAKEIFEYGHLKDRKDLCYTAVDFIIKNKHKFEKEKLKTLHQNPYFSEIILNKC